MIPTPLRTAEYGTLGPRIQALLESAPARTLLPHQSCTEYGQE